MSDIYHEGMRALQDRAKSTGCRTSSCRPTRRAKARRPPVPGWKRQPEFREALSRDDPGRES